ncbi:uncharacterized protein LOC126744472 [Anthonomus grandis grandis]|uniref:uncharacterized protein LOC126744472 n=1 Tax=Anthonomus grandis grandis TaxID=2921223 RepID=UPI0021654560|nr:uncharacterized protein LOC126744472 [Anthonomus grandis grandis]
MGYFLIKYCFFVLTILFLTKPSAANKRCLEIKKSYEKTCMESEHENYVHCVRARMKRHQQDCELSESCFDCNCDSCSYSECGGNCDYCCNSCCSNYVQCHTNHCCHKQCHSECRSYNCRSACRRSCYNFVEREKEGFAVNDIRERERIIEKIIQAGVIGNTSTNVNNTNVHNITTIINLKNVLNHTNILDVPINLTYTNKNNITLQEGDINGNGGCCVVIGPRQCIPLPTPPYSRCFHTRSKQCGSYCGASIVHEENRQVCNSVNGLGQPINCEQQKAYVPQPKPRCTYTSTWPYVSCGIQPSAECQGCYGHYFNAQDKQFKLCPPQCYDDFGVGPLYRQGPYYQPGYSHIPPCMYSPQGCGGFGAGFGFGGSAMMPGLGGYGMFPGASPGIPGFGQTGFGGFGLGGPGIHLPLGGGPFDATNLDLFNGNLTWNGLNLTKVNNKTEWFQPEIIDLFSGNQQLYGPMNQYQQKEIEIDVANSDLNDNRISRYNQYKREADVHPKRIEEASLPSISKK